MELDLVTALTAANITVLQPSHIQQEDKPVDVPYLFVRLFSVVRVENATIMHACFVSSLHNMPLHTYSSSASFLYNSIITGKVCKNHLLKHV